MALTDFTPFILPMMSVGVTLLHDQLVLSTGERDASGALDNYWTVGAARMTWPSALGLALAFVPCGLLSVMAVYVPDVGRPFGPVYLAAVLWFPAVLGGVRHARALLGVRTALKGGGIREG